MPLNRKMGYFLGSLNPVNDARYTAPKNECNNCFLHRLFVALEEMQKKHWRLLEYVRLNNKKCHRLFWDQYANGFLGLYVRRNAFIFFDTIIPPMVTKRSG